VEEERDSQIRLVADNQEQITLLNKQVDEVCSILDCCSIWLSVAFVQVMNGSLCILNGLFKFYLH